MNFLVYLECKEKDWIIQGNFINKEIKPEIGWHLTFSDGQGEECLVTKIKYEPCTDPEGLTIYCECKADDMIFIFWEDKNCLDEQLWHTYSMSEKAKQQFLEALTEFGKS